MFEAVFRLISSRHFPSNQCDEQLSAADVFSPIETYLLYSRGTRHMQLHAEEFRRQTHTQTVYSQSKLQLQGKQDSLLCV